jgi:hypothetical protein
MASETCCLQLATNRLGDIRILRVHGTCNNSHWKMYVGLVPSHRNRGTRTTTRLPDFPAGRVGSSAALPLRPMIGRWVLSAGLSFVHFCNAGLYDKVTERKRDLACGSTTELLRLTMMMLMNTNKMLVFYTTLSQAGHDGLDLLEKKFGDQNMDDYYMM